MAASCLEIRFPSQFLGATAAGDVWLGASRSAPSLVSDEWSRPDLGADQVVRLSPRGTIEETRETPRLVRVLDRGGRLVGLAGRASSDSLVGTRDASGALGFDLRVAQAWTDRGTVACVQGDFVVLDPGDAGTPCPVWDVVNARRLGAYAPRKTQQFFCALDSERVYVSGANTAAFARDGKPLWTSPIHTAPAAGIAAFAGDLWLVLQDEKGHELLCCDGTEGTVSRRSRVPPVHTLVATEAGLFVGHELGTALVRTRAGRVSTLLKARVNVAATDGSGWAAFDRESRRLYLARSMKSAATVLDLASAAPGFAELELVEVVAGAAVLRPFAEVEDERTSVLLGEERLPRIGRQVTWVPLVQRGKDAKVVAKRWVAELVDSKVRVRGSSDRALALRTDLPELELTEGQRRLAASLERQGLVPRAWRKKLESELLRDEHAGALGSLLAAVYTGATDKGHRVGFAAWGGLRQRGAQGLVADFERLLRNEPVKLRRVELEEDQTSILIAVGRSSRSHELGATDDPRDLVRAINQELDAAGAERRLHALDAALPLVAVLLCEPERVVKLRRAGLKGIAKLEPQGELP